MLTFVVFFDYLQLACFVEIRLVGPLALELDPKADLVLGIGVPQRLLVRNRASLEQIVQRLVERLHTEAVRLRHDLLDRGDFAAEDKVGDERRVEHDLHGRNPPLYALSRHQPLRDHGPDVERQVHEELLATVVGEEVYDAVEGLVRAVGVQRGEHEVTGLGELDAVFHGVAVADFADQDHIGRLPQRVLERHVPALGVDTHLALRHHAVAMRVYVLDRVLDRDYVTAGLLVAVVDHRRERGRLARARGAYDDAEAALRQHDLLEDRRQLEILDRRHLDIDGAQHRASESHLHEGTDAEAADSRWRYREIAFLRSVEFLRLAVVHDRPHQQRSLLG